MTTKSDLILPRDKFADAAVPGHLTTLNNGLVGIMQDIPKWYEVGAERYRQMRWNNETALPRPPILDHGKDCTIPSREAGREIPIRVFLPKSGKPVGTFYHIHGGGWVLQTEHYQDELLDFYAQKANLAVVSVGYRLAPEDPFPKGPEDCYDTADYLLANAEKEYGAPLLFIGGESAGGHLSLLTLLHLHKTHPSFVLPPNGGLVLHFGCYDLSNMLPAVQHFLKPLILNKEIMHAFVNAFLPNTTAEQRADPSISPLYADWKGIAAQMRERGASGLPRALLTIGTEDPLLDDSVFMAAKWQICGGESVLKVYPGAPHGWIAFDSNKVPEAGQALDDTRAFILETLGTN